MMKHENLPPLSSPLLPYTPPCPLSLAPLAQGPFGISGASRPGNLVRKNPRAQQVLLEPIVECVPP
jgi:hypothetical protein